LYFIKIS